MWNSARCLGMFLGPTIGGSLIDHHGYQETAFVFIGIYCLTVTADVMEIWLFQDNGVEEEKGRHSWVKQNNTCTFYVFNCRPKTT